MEHTEHDLWDLSTSNLLAWAADDLDLTQLRQALNEWNILGAPPRPGHPCAFTHKHMVKTIDMFSLMDRDYQQMMDSPQTTDIRTQ